MMRRICWPAWISTISMVAFVLLASGCQASEPLVPREIYQQVNDDGREWTYDTAWQNIRMLNSDLEAGDFTTVRDQTLFIVSQMERLEKGKASPLSSSVITDVIETESQKAVERSEQLNRNEIRERGLALQESFDDGDFEAAKGHALAVYGLAQSF